MNVETEAESMDKGSGHSEAEGVTRLAGNRIRERAIKVGLRIKECKGPKIRRAGVVSGSKDSSHAR